MKKRIELVLIVAAVSLVVTCAGFWLAEAGANPNVRNLGDVLWWWIVTSATVGYGDIVPHTAAGRFIGGLAIISGFYVFANLVALTAESLHAFLERKSRGRVQVTATDHVVLCEYTAVADELIHALPRSRTLADRQVAIITDLVQQNPYPQHGFVFGVPINPANLRRANVAHAAYVFVFANLRFADPDIKSLHVASRIREINPTVPILIELIQPENPLVAYCAGPVVPLSSRQLMECVLKRHGIDPDGILAGIPAAATASPA